MAEPPLLHTYLENSARKVPDRPAILHPNGDQISYLALNTLADTIAETLSEHGVTTGDRVGVAMTKSIATIAGFFGILKAGAAYVPVDVDAPIARGIGIFADCGVGVILTDLEHQESLMAEVQRIHLPAAVCVLDPSKGIDTIQEGQTSGRDLINTEDLGPYSLAYILYTSGSTGVPKGVMLTHANAIAFIDWCSDTFLPTSEDTFSSHAPFHFDLSILDLYLPVKHGASLMLIPDPWAKNPADCAALISSSGITVWYSTPTMLTLMLQYGKLDQQTLDRLRIVLFAGEVFPIKHLSALMNAVPHPEYYNLYGPTETNVCTFYKVPAALPDDRTEPFPIGIPSSGDCVKVIDESGTEVDRGERGELTVSGPSVMQGYWNRMELTAEAMIYDDEGNRWYKTGDIVFQDAEANYVYVGRRDRMVKRRGYRIELGEIEAALYQHPDIQEAGVVAVPHDEDNVHIVAHLRAKPSVTLSGIALKSYCSTKIPLYMVPDRFKLHEKWPQTSTGKTDYQKLIEES